MLLEIAEGVNDARLRLCLDVGHVNAYSDVPVETWLRILAPHISHFHIHSNAGDADTHSAPGEGSVDVEAIMDLADRLCPEATFTMEVMQAAEAARWLSEKGFFK